MRKNDTKVSNKKEIKEPPQPPKLSSREKIARAMKAQKMWGNRRTECEAKLNQLQGELNARALDILEDEPNLTMDELMQQVTAINQPSQMDLINKNVEKTLKSRDKK